MNEHNDLHHDIFNKFQRFSGEVPDVFDIDFIGQQTHASFVSSFPQRNGEAIVASLPSFDEEYFEWIDILEAVETAQDQFTMLELGAGFGRWSARAALAARQKKLPFTIGLVEAEPAHVEWIKAHMRHNHISKQEYRLFECAIGESVGDIYFYIGMPDGYENNSPSEWYGQSVIKDYEKLKQKYVKSTLLSKWFPKKKYYGHEVVEFKSNWKAVKVRQRKFSDVLNEFKPEIIDICDFDVQGNELSVIKEAIDILNKRVRRLHIGTHAHDLEEGLVELLSAQNWELIRNYACHQEHMTEYGKIAFVDGVQTWYNKRF